MKSEYSTPPLWDQIARQFHVHFDGFQETPDGQFPQFTCNEYGTFYVTKEDETLERAIERKKREYSK